MILLVADVSIFLEFERNELMVPLFAAGLTIAAVDLLCYELRAAFGTSFFELGLHVLDLFPDELGRAQALWSSNKTLSLSECFALVRACRGGHILVTASPHLQSVAQAYGVVTLGWGWLAEQVMLNIASPALTSAR